MILKYDKVLDLREKISDLKRTAKTVGFVPTMGYLHDGHLSLVKEAKKQNDIVVVSIFVNPTQFGENEDLSVYPRDLDRDLKLLEGHADIVFNPSVTEVYGNDLEASYNVRVIENKKSKILCGQYRSGHFDGVLSIVLKLFNMVNPDKAYFGEKDYQQLMLIQEMQKALNLPIEIVGMPLIREQDGLAMSSRNTYLDTDARQKALKISKALFYLKEKFYSGVNSVLSLKREALLKLVPDVDVQYIEFINSNLELQKDKVQTTDRIVFAGFVHTQDRTVRLIDNLEL